ncbi:MAG TPA: MarR family transcriptional regulator [Thermoanaerobaculia bacterium]|nr:MarR family transcriptional regulator [Thermoanaerobaculia bacterium]
MNNGARQDDGGRPLMSADDYQALAAFRYALRQFLRFSEEAARRAGVTPQQYLAMIAVRGFPGRDRLTVSELAERLQIRHHSAVGLIDRMVAQGLMVRQPGGADRRQVFVSLTQRGAELLEPLAAAHRDQLQRIGGDLRQILERLR